MAKLYELVAFGLLGGAIWLLGQPALQAFLSGPWAELLHALK